MDGFYIGCKLCAVAVIERTSTKKSCTFICDNYFVFCWVGSFIQVSVLLLFSYFMEIGSVSLMLFKFVCLGGWGWGEDGIGRGYRLLKGI